MKKQILVAALAVIGAQILFSPAAESYNNNWNRVAVPYGGYGYGASPYYNNLNTYNNGYCNNGYYNNRILRHERHLERRAIRHWDHRHNRWF